MATEFTTPPFISYQGQSLDFASICQALEQIGVKAGDDICVHSSLMRLGKILVTLSNYSILSLLLFVK